MLHIKLSRLNQAMSVIFVSSGMLVSSIPEGTGGLKIPPSSLCCWQALWLIITISIKLAHQKALGRFICLTRMKPRGPRWRLLPAPRAASWTHLICRSPVAHKRILAYCMVTCPGVYLLWRNEELNSMLLTVRLDHWGFEYVYRTVRKRKESFQVLSVSINSRDVSFHIVIYVRHVSVSVWMCKCRVWQFQCQSCETMQWQAAVFWMMPVCHSEWQSHAL